jgi:hypothetical protein
LQINEGRKILSTSYMELRWIVSHNLRKGIPNDTVQIAEYRPEKGLLG